MHGFLIVLMNIGIHLFLTYGHFSSIKFPVMVHYIKWEMYGFPTEFLVVYAAKPIVWQERRY